MKRFKKSVKNFFLKNNYFKKLFPVIKEEKPGVDFYAVISIVQLILIAFLVLCYTQMDPNYTNNTSQQLDNFIFSGTMVLFVFLQIIIIVIDRYLYLAKKFVVVD